MFRSARWCFATGLVLLIGLQLFSFLYYVREQRLLTAYFDRVARPSLPPSEQVKAVVLSLKDKPDDGNNSYFLFPFLRFLRPTPGQVIFKGGDCADRSRLVIALLARRGIHASKWALYNARGESVHAVVQADVESGKMVADPLFGLWFPKRQDGYYAIRDLKEDPAILLNRLAELRASNARPGAARWDFYPSAQYVYSDARTINWSKSLILKLSYWLLRRVMGQRADELARPAFVEEPPLIVIYGTAALEFIVLLVWLGIRRWQWKRRTTAAAGWHRIAEKTVGVVRDVQLKGREDGSGFLDH